MINILIADDHPIVRQGLRQVINETADLVVTGEAGNAAEALYAVSQQNYDVILLDISMPGRSGLEVLCELKNAKPNLRVLILSTYPEGQYAVRAFKDGADGYLTKLSAPEELLTAIRKVALGGKYVSPELAEKLAFDLEKNVDKPLHERLSDREYEVMCMIAAGKTVTEIAQELSLSAKTISTYRARILEKMQMKNNAEMMLYAIKQGLVR
jgi:DNA-binding NarL/FixJ family response regulator